MSLFSFLFKDLVKKSKEKENDSNVIRIVKDKYKIYNECKCGKFNKSNAECCEECGSMEMTKVAAREVQKQEDISRETGYDVPCWLNIGEPYFEKAEKDNINV